VATEPELRELGSGHQIACHWAEEITPQAIEAAIRAGAGAPSADRQPAGSA
jgi:hypothetical protein